MKVRFAKFFNGSRDIPAYRTQLQYFDSDLGRWVNVETEWASSEDEQKYLKAQDRQYEKEIR